MFNFRIRIAILLTSIFGVALFSIIVSNLKCDTVVAKDSHSLDSAFFEVDKAINELKLLRHKWQIENVNSDIKWNMYNRKRKFNTEIYRTIIKPQLRVHTKI